MDQAGNLDVRFGSRADIASADPKSASPPKADMLIVGVNVCKVPLGGDSFNTIHLTPPSLGGFTLSAATADR